MRISKFILFAHPRSGSTSLANVLILHPDLNVLMEPLQEKFHLWCPSHPNHLSRVKDADSLDAQLREIFATCDGFKTVNWPLPFDLYAHMISHPLRKIIFLRRRDLLKASVSCAIAHRTGVWQKKDLKGDSQARYEGLGAIPEREVFDWIEAVQEDMDRYAAILDAKPPNTVHNVLYEDLFGADVPRQDETLGGVLDFLGVRRVRSPEMDRVLDKTKTQINSSETYSFVQNYREIDRLGVQRGCGSLFTE